MKSTIKKILREQSKPKSHYQKLADSRLKNFAYKLIQKNDNDEDSYSHSYYRVHHVIEDIQELLSIQYTDAAFLVFSYMIDEGDDPTEYLGLHDWLYKSSNPIDFLKISGYYEDYVDLDAFNDIKETDGKIVFHFDSWVDFAPWFDDTDLAEQILDEDWFELFSAYDDELEHMLDSLNAEGTKYILDTIIEDFSGEVITGLSHREEFQYMFNEHGEIVVDDNMENIRNLTDPYNLSIFLSEGDELSHSDLVSHIRSSFHNGYNQAAEDELFHQLIGEIEDFLGAKHERGDMTYDLTNSLVPLVDAYITKSHENPTETHTYFMDMVAEYFREYSEGLDTPNVGYYYPDSGKVIENFNDYLIQGY